MNWEVLNKNRMGEGALGPDEPCALKRVCQRVASSREAAKESPEVPVSF